MTARPRGSREDRRAHPQALQGAVHDCPPRRCAEARLRNHGFPVRLFLQFPPSAAGPLPRSFRQTRRSSSRSIFQLHGRTSLLDTVVETGRVYCASRDPHFYLPQHRHFFDTVQRMRPHQRHRLRALEVSPRASSGTAAWDAPVLGRPNFIDSEMELFRFIAGFLDDAYQRSRLPIPLEEDRACLDYHGCIVDAGPRIKDSFDELFGPWWPCALLPGAHRRGTGVQTGSTRAFFAADSAEAWTV